MRPLPTRRIDVIYDLRLLLCLTTISLLFVISGPTLSALGIEYVLPGGNPLYKVHPATYFAVITLAILSLSGEYRRLESICLIENPGIPFFFFSWLALLLYIITFLDNPATATIDTFFLAIVMFVIVQDLTFRQTRLVAMMIDIYMVGNSMLAVYELVSGFHLIALTVGSAAQGLIAYPNEWRPTGLLGHPLNGAAISGCYVLSLLFTDRYKPLVRLPLIGIGGLGLVAYSSRSAVGFTALCVGLYMLFEAASVLLDRRPKQRFLENVMVIGPAVVLLGVLLVWSGFLDRFIDRFSNDNGSALARSVMFDILMEIPLSELVFGPSFTTMMGVLQRFGVLAIESFWVSWLMFYGMIGCVVLFPGLFAFVRATVKITKKEAVWIWLFFFLNASVSVSIASKSLLFAQVVVIVLTSLRRQPARVRASVPHPQHGLHRRPHTLYRTSGATARS